MLHILILILKIIGIIIAVILGILLLLIAIFLFAPVHYEVQGRCDGDLGSLKGKVQITWLLSLIRADILYKNGKMKWRLRLAWIKRGTTGLFGKGMYTGENKLILICAASRGDVAKVKDIAVSIDNKSFIIIANAREVLGKGFK